MKRILPMLISLLLVPTECGGSTSDGYQQITQAEAKEMMDTQEVIVLDEREQPSCCRWEPSTRIPPLR